MTGRFAPSPTGALHVGNLRTALVAWLLARAERRPFLVRMEDLDRVQSSPVHETSQLADLTAIGIDWDGAVARQSERFDRYHRAIDLLTSQDMTYECFCTRREIRESSAAPHGPLPEGAYPGTCRHLSERERSSRRAARPPALRLRSQHQVIAVDDLLAGSFTGAVDDVVLRRNDGVPAYNLAVVVDDAAQGVTEVVRGDDLLDSTPRQVLLQRLLGLPPVRYAHVPLVVGDDGDRLAKRHRATTLEDLRERGIDGGRVRAGLATSLGLRSADGSTTPDALVAAFEIGDLRARGRAPVTLADLQRSWS